jgi:hypothetical protein
MTRIQGRRAIRILLSWMLLALAACGSEEAGEDPETPAPEVEDPGIVVRHVEPPARGPSPAGRGLDTDPHGLRVRIEAREEAIEIGEPLLLDVSIRNVSGKEQRLFRPERGFERSCTVLVTPPGGKPLRFRVHREGGPERAEDFLRLPPGESVAARCDVAPLLARMDRSPPGAYGVALVFDSPFTGEPFGVRAWNELGYKEVVSNTVRVELTWPDWKTGLGVDADLERQVVGLLDAIGPDGTMDPAYRDLLEQMGGPAIAVLDDKMGGCAESGLDANLRGWNAIYALLSVRDRALPHLATSRHAARPANLYLMDLIAELDAPGGDQPLAPILTALAEGRGTHSPFSARLTRHPTRGGPTSVSVQPGGRVEIVESVGETSRLVTAFLDEKEVRPVFLAMRAGLFWVQRPLRTSGGAKEALLRVELRKGRDRLHGADVWETEALVGNRHLSRIVRTIREVEKKARSAAEKRGESSD